MNSREVPTQAPTAANGPWTYVQVAAGSAIGPTTPQGTQFLHGLVPANAVVRLKQSAVRRGVDRLRSMGTVVVDATGTFLPPGDSLRGLLGTVSHPVVTTTGRRDHLDPLVAQLDWLSRHGYEGLVSSATLVVSELDAGTTRTASGGRAVDLVGEVCRVPYDDALRGRGLVDHASLSPATRQSFADLARVVRAALEDGNRH